MVRVNWPARAALPDKRVIASQIVQLEKNGASISLDDSIAAGSLVKLEFVVNYREAEQRIRVKGQVISNSIVSLGKGVLTRVRFIEVDAKTAHIIGNLLQLAILDHSSGVSPRQ